MSLRDFFSNAPLPIIEWFGERCIHHRFAAATCRCCVEHCPSQAWRLDEDGLSLDSERCDGCGLCVPACPEQALRPPDAYAPAADDGDAALFACDRSGARAGLGIVPCIHALSAGDLLKLYRRRIRRLKLAVADCADCSRRPRLGLEERVARLNRALRHDGLGEIRLAFLSVKAWSRQRQDFSPGMKAGLDRRAFFRRALHGGLEQLPDGGAEVAAERANEPLGRLLRELGASRLPPNLPEIDPLRCDACLDCVRACPHSALALRGGGDAGAPGQGLELAISASDCSGCGVCIDLCRPGAITLRHWRPQAQAALGLRLSHHCPQCGMAIHTASQPLPANAPCAICRQRHHRPDRVCYG